MGEKRWTKKVLVKPCKKVWGWKLCEKVWVKKDGRKSIGQNFVESRGENFDKSIGENFVKSIGENVVKSMGENFVKSYGWKRWVKKVWVKTM